MSIQYKNQSIALSTTNLTTVLTISTSAIAIVKVAIFLMEVPELYYVMPAFMIAQLLLIMNFLEIMFCLVR